MIDLPENEVQGRMKSIRLVRFINVAKNQVNQTITENENKKSAKNVVSNRVNNTSNVEENQIEDIPSSDDLVHHNFLREATTQINSSWTPISDKSHLGSSLGI